jgi:hypothetical protein
MESSMIYKRKRRMKHSELGEAKKNGSDCYGYWDQDFI